MGSSVCSRTDASWHGHVHNRLLQAHGHSEGASRQSCVATSSRTCMHPKTHSLKRSHVDCLRSSHLCCCKALLSHLAAQRVIVNRVTSRCQSAFHDSFFFSALNATASECLCNLALTKKK